MFPRLLSFLTVQVSEIFRDPDLFPRSPRGSSAASEDLSVAQGLGGRLQRRRRTIFAGDPISRRGPGGSDAVLRDRYQSRRAARAEAGIYSLDRMPLFTENHRKAGGKSSLSDYYSAAYGRASFDKSLRRNVVFSDHSLVTDAVFAEMQLVSCRNVMIYFDKACRIVCLVYSGNRSHERVFSDWARRKAYALVNMLRASPSRARRKDLSKAYRMIANPPRPW